MIWIKSAKYLRGHEIAIQFNDNAVAVVDLKNELNGKIFKPLKKITEFKKFKLDSKAGTIFWSNGANFAPEFLWELAQLQKINEK